MGARLGQHFLFDPSILGRIAEAALPEPGEVALEIGPGRGTLTRELARRAARVVAIETDRRLAAELAASVAGGNVTVVHGDALRVPWPEADVVCGNIPYRITSALLERALLQRPRRIVFLVQREVADRLAAEPGTPAYGALTVGVALVATVERLLRVRAGAFRPPPRVESALVRLVPRPEPLVGGAEEKATRRLVRAAFGRRRQQLQRTLRESYHLSAAHCRALLASLGLSPDVRAETLAPETFVALARRLVRP